MLATLFGVGVDIVLEYFRSVKIPSKSWSAFILLKCFVILIQGQTEHVKLLVVFSMSLACQSLPLIAVLYGQHGLYIEF